MFCTFMVVYLILFMMNLQYMSKTISRYQIRFLNHKGDIYNVIPMIVLTITVLLFRRFYQFEQIGNGQPVVDYPHIIPRGNDAYAYYNLPDPKAKKEPKMIDMHPDDEYMSHFYFADVNRIMPSNDAACPGDGSCREDN